MVTDEPLTAAFEAALVRELRELYGRINRTRFGGRLTPPVMVLSDAASRLGLWVPTGRRLELSRAMVITRPWPEVTSVIEHEMAHQFVIEVLGVRDEAPHGPTFQRVCGERGIDARAGGVPMAAATEVNRTLERVRKLLALASSPNQHEAELAMRKAHELMLRHNIDSLGADHAYEIRHLGEAGRRSNRVELDIVSLLAEFFFVKVIRVPVYLPREARTGALFEISGTRPNVEMACHVHAFLLATAERLWRDNRADPRVRSGRDRVQYQAGVIGGFREKLLFERSGLQREGLVWVGDSDLDRFYRLRHPHIVTRRRSVSMNHAHVAGREAGRTVVLRTPATAGPSSGPLRLLRP